MAAEEMDRSASARRCRATPSAPAAQLVLLHDRGSGGRVAPVTSLVSPWSCPGLRYGGEGAASGSRLCPRRAGSLGQVAAVSGHLEQARTRRSWEWRGSADAASWHLCCGHRLLAPLPRRFRARLTADRRSHFAPGLGRTRGCTDGEPLPWRDRHPCTSCHPRAVSQSGYRGGERHSSERPGATPRAN